MEKNENANAIFTPAATGFYQNTNVAEKMDFTKLLRFSTQNVGGCTNGSTSEGGG